MRFKLAFEWHAQWETILDTFDDQHVGEIHHGAVWYALAPHSLAGFTMHRGRRPE